MNKSTKYVLLPLLLLSPVLYAEDDDCDGCEIEAGDFYIGVHGGISFSNDADMEVPVGPNTITDWDPAPEGYNSDLGNSQVLGASVGYTITPLIMVEIEAANRGSFQYEKQQTGQTPKTRHFDLNNTTIMANAIFNGSGLEDGFAYKAESFMLDPFIKIGAGIAYNTVSDFHSTYPNETVSVTMNDHTESTFAYQLGAGLNVRTDSPLVVGLGYRYLDAGDFSSDNYLTNANITIEPWKGDLTANEIYLELSYLFD